MATIVTRAGKGSPLTHNEVDANFTNLNTDKYQSGDSPTFNAVTVTGTLALNADPTTSLEAATKQYVDTIAAAGLHYHAPVRVEAPSALTATYSNGSSGVGATLTNSGTQAALVIDGITLSVNDRVLVYTQATASENGIYYVSDTGSASTNWVLTRTTDTDSYGASDPDALGQGDAFFVLQGDTGAGELYVMNTEGTITFGTTGITFTQVAATAVYTAGTGLTLTGTEFSADQDIAASASPTFAGLTVNGSISVTGTVDGRDLATDGTKLDGIEAGATADQSAAEILAAVTTVDGSGSGLDADFLDGQEGSYFLNTATTFGGDVSGTYDAIVVADDSHNHIISNVDGLQTELDGKASTSHNHSLGSLSDVTITSNTAGEILKWDGSAWVNNTLAEAGILSSGGIVAQSYGLNNRGYGDGEFSWYQTSGTHQSWSGGWASHLISNHGDGSNYYNQTIIMPFWGAPYYMRKEGGTNVGPYQFWTSENSSFVSTSDTSWQRIANSAGLNRGSYGSISISGQTNGYAGIDFTDQSMTLMARNDATGFYYNNSTWRVYWDGSGNQWNAGNVTAYYSDERLKTKTGKIESALEKVQSLSGFYYVENDVARGLGYKNDREQVALSAQEVRAVMPHAVSLAPIDMETLDDGSVVSKSGENYLTVDYARLVPLLVEAIKEQQTQIDDLKARLEALE